MTSQLKLSVVADWPRAAAGAVLDFAAGSACTLPDVTVVLPHAALMGTLERALPVEARRAVLLPRITTLEGLLAAHSPRASQAARVTALYAALRGRPWFDRQGGWPLCRELVSLFDELTLSSLSGGCSGEAYLSQLERAYRLRGSRSLQFEARLVHELWHAELQEGRNGAALRQVAIDGLAQWGAGPLVVLADARPAPEMVRLLERWGREAPVLSMTLDRDHLTSPVLMACQAAWPMPEGCKAAPRVDESALARGKTLAARLPDSPLSHRLRLQSAASLEALAQTVASQVRAWVDAGRERIALVAADRVACRRVRALLERDDILVLDETGWRLSTTRAGALVNALLEVVSANAYYRDVLDLLKSPFILGDQPAWMRRDAALAVERVLRRHGIHSGLQRYRDAVERESARLPDFGREAIEVLARLKAATERLPASRTTLSRWIDRLRSALDALGALEPLRTDAAGSALLDLLAVREDELRDAGLNLGFGEWREWLGQELDAALFRDRSIESPVVMTPLESAVLRPFDAAVVIGADAANLQPAMPGGLFGNPAVRAELGLGSPQEAQHWLEAQLSYLIAIVPEVVMTWQSFRDGEPNLLAPTLERLSVLHQAAWGIDLVAPVAAPDAYAPPVALGTPPPKPTVAATLLPTRISASGYESLVRCPYQYYARRVLRLQEQDDVREALEKRDYGELLHGVLHRFHQRYPVLISHEQTVLCDALATESRQAFARSVEENFLEHGWLARWLKRIPAYIRWQSERETEGWQYDGSERSLSVDLPLSEGKTLTLEGRLDRLDRKVRMSGEPGLLAVLDYKAQGAARLRERAKDPDGEVQLPFYVALMDGKASEAAWVALDDAEPTAVAMPDVEALAAAQRTRLADVFSRMLAGEAVPAHGDAQTCRWCEMRGLCRRDWWGEGPGASDAKPGEGTGEAA